MTKKILVADDSEGILEVVRMGFESLDYLVLTARDGEEALAQVERECPDIILLDIMMPKKNGYEVCRQLKNDPRFAHIPIVMLTAKAQKEDRFWGRDAGADDYVTKPFDPMELEGIVERLLQLRERGESYHPLTKLPTYVTIEREIAGRRSRGEDFGLANFSYSGEALSVFKQKYGEIVAEEVIQITANTVKETVERVAGPSAFVGHRGEANFVVIAKADELLQIKRLLEGEMARMLPEFYTAEDRQRGYVQAGDERYPLLSLVSSL